MKKEKRKKVRLSDHDLLAIENLFNKHFLPGDQLWLFGSRANLTKKGGDIDLYVETQAKTADDAVRMKSRFLSDLECEIGEQKIDIVLNMINNSAQLPIYEVAKIEGVRII